MPPIRPFLPILLAVALAGPGLRADDYQYLGLQVGAGSPLGEFGAWTGDHPGYALGLQQMINEGEGNILRTRLDYFGGMKGQATRTLPSPEGIVRVGLENSFTVVSLGFESMYWVQGDIKQGLYLFGGLGGASTRLVSAVQGNADGGGANWPASGTLASTSNKFFYAFGFGWQYNRNMGAEVRYLASRWSNSEYYLRVDYLTAALTLRFP